MESFLIFGIIVYALVYLPLSTSGILPLPLSCLIDVLKYALDPQVQTVCSKSVGYFYLNHHFITNPSVVKVVEKRPIMLPLLNGSGQPLLVATVAMTHLMAEAVRSNLYRVHGFLLRTRSRDSD